MTCLLERSLLFSRIRPANLNYSSGPYSGSCLTSPHYCELSIASDVYYNKYAHINMKRKHFVTGTPHQAIATGGPTLLSTVITHTVI